MLKLKEGKIMIINLVIIVCLVAMVALLMPMNEGSKFITVAILIMAVFLIIFAVLQVILAMKLYAIAREMAQVESKNEINIEE